MDALRKDGDSIGARIDVVAQNVPVGLGEPLYDKLDAEIAYALMGINAVKGVEIGAGFRSVAQKGSEHGDALTPEGFVGNNAGGILGGISTGQDITASIAIKPTSSIRTPRRPSTRTASRSRWKPSVATTPAWASAPRPSPKPCWPWC
jgi:chorismate synthase